MGVSIGARTDVGRTRKLNEDRIYAGENVWAVADGMGGHAAGDVASAIVVSHLRQLDRSGLQQHAVVEALLAANLDILTHGEVVPASRGLGSTVTGVARVFIGGAEHWAVFNVGDSRVYRLASAGLARATVDHSEVEELILQGLITEEEARWHSSRSVITRSIGTLPPPVVDLWVLPQTPGERFLICSDGLTSEITDDAIAAILGGNASPEAAAQDLVEAALAAGGRDNVSVIVVDVQGSTNAGLDVRATNPRSALVKEGGESWPMVH